MHTSTVLRARKLTRAHAMRQPTRDRNRGSPRTNDRNNERNKWESGRRREKLGVGREGNEHEKKRKEIVYFALIILTKTNVLAL